MSSGLSRLAILSAVVAWTLAVSVRVVRADDAMPKTLAEAIDLEAKDALPLTAFYDPPELLRAAAPGTLIRSQPFAGYELPKGATAVRILYHSLALNGDDIVVSGVVLIPGGKPPAGGWPLIAWAHGTSGVARMCAPSLMRDVEYGDEGLMPMVAAGFAVVATDYAGLGAPGPHAYLNKIPQASDVIYSVPAARQAVHTLGSQWVAIGHSQGGMAVWGVAEREATLRDPTYVGGVSVAGYMDTEAWASAGVVPDPETALYWPMQAFGIKASYPSFDVARMLTPAGMSVYEEVTTKGCYYRSYVVSRELGQKPLVYPNWAAAPEVKKYLRDSQSADKPIAGPLLVVAGDDDNTVSIKSIRRSVHHACHIGLPIEFWHRPGLDHDPLMQQMTPEILRWARARLDHESWTATCAIARTTRIGAAELTAGAQPADIIDNTAFVPGRHAAPAHQAFRGTLHLAEVEMTTRPADLNAHRVLGKDAQYFPGFAVDFITVDGDLVPATEEVIRAGSRREGRSYWDIIVQPGRVWSEAADHGWSRAAFPFALVHTLEGETHNGLATFLYRGSQVSHLRFQIVQQTTPGHIETYFTAVGVTAASFTPAARSDWEVIERNYRASVKDAVPIRPWSELERRVGRARLAGFDDGLAAEQTVLTGIDYHGVFYTRGCSSAGGPLPWCDRIRFGIWSVTKAMANEVALLRLAQKYGPGVFDLRIRDYVPEVAAHPEWANVRFDDCINMATGLGNGSTRRDPNDIVDGYIDATYNDWADAPSRSNKVAALLRIAHVYPWGPGKVVRYRDQDMYLLGVAMDQFLKSKEGPSADLWSMLEREVFGPIGIHYAPINRTIETDGIPAQPLMAYGYYATISDLVKVARLYHDRGRHGGVQLLYEPRIDELRAGTTPRGLPTGQKTRFGETTYFNAFWEMRYDATGGCKLYIPQMVGWGENLVALFPDGLTGIRIAHDPPDDSASGRDPTAMARVADRLEAFCAPDGRS